MTYQTIQISQHLRILKPWLQHRVIRGNSISLSCHPRLTGGHTVDHSHTIRTRMRRVLLVFFASCLVHLSNLARLIPLLSCSLSFLLFFSSRTESVAEKMLTN